MFETHALVRLPSGRIAVVIEYTDPGVVLCEYTGGGMVEIREKFLRLAAAPLEPALRR